MFLLGFSDDLIVYVGEVFDEGDIVSFCPEIAKDRIKNNA